MRCSGNRSSEIGFYLFSRCVGVCSYANDSERVDVNVEMWCLLERSGAVDTDHEFAKHLTRDAMNCILFAVSKVREGDADFSCV